MSPLLRSCGKCHRTTPDDGHDHCAACRRQATATRERKRQAAKARQPYGTGQWRGLREQVKAAQGGRCASCGKAGPLDVHHRNGNNRDMRRANLVALCRACHNRADADRRAASRGLLIAIVGVPGTGKSAIADKVALTIGAHLHRIDDYRLDDTHGSWDRMMEALTSSRAPAVVESNLVPGRYRALMAKRRATVVQLRCEPMERERRLIARGDPPNRVAKYLMAPARHVDADLTIDTGQHSAAEAARAIVAHAGR